MHPSLDAFERNKWSTLKKLFTDSNKKPHPK